MRVFAGAALVALCTSVIALPSTVRACGGLFCDNIQPVVQTAERILFVMNEGEVEVYVEVQYQGPPSAFAWVIPVPSDLSLDDIDVAPAGMFDELERLAAPIFEYVEPVSGDGEGAGGSASYDSGLGSDQGCAIDNPPLPRRGEGGTDSPPAPDTSGVEVVGDAVVGPYAIELITAQGGANLTNWLALNGYQVPLAAVEPLDGYVEGGMSFVGVKLDTEVAEGPIDALRFTYAGDTASIPLRLTAIAAIDDMDIIAYVGAAGRYGPDPAQMDFVFDYDSVRWLGGGETNYLELLLDGMREREGLAFHTEHARELADMPALTGLELESILAPATYLTRFHGFADATEMTTDPRFIAVASRGDQRREHTIYGSAEDGEEGPPGSGGGAGPGWGLLTPIVWVVARRRRRPAAQSPRRRSRSIEASARPALPRWR